MKYNQIKKRIYEILETSKKGDKLSLIDDYLISGLIFLSILSVVIESVESIGAKYHTLFYIFEIISVTVFTIEYILRAWAINVNKKWKNPGGRIKYLVRPMMIIDLLAIMPFYLPMLIGFDLRVLRGLRLLRLTRIVKLTRYSKSLKTLENVLKREKELLAMSVFVSVILLTISSSIMYYAEQNAQPDKFSSIPEAMWWGVATLTTVGYGDIYPITPFGKLFGALSALLGVGMIAVPAGIIGSGFVEEAIKGRKP